MAKCSGDIHITMTGDAAPVLRPSLADEIRAAISYHVAASQTASLDRAETHSRAAQTLADTLDALQRSY
jgi:hypothetical protein